MPGCFLHVLELGAIFERRRNECRAHRVRRVAAIKPELGSTFSHHAIDRVGVHPSALVPAFAVVLERPEQGARRHRPRGRPRRGKREAAQPSTG